MMTLGDPSNSLSCQGQGLTDGPAFQARESLEFASDFSDPCSVSCSGEFRSWLFRLRHNSKGRIFNAPPVRLKRLKRAGKGGRGVKGVAELSLRINFIPPIVDLVRGIR